MSTESYPTIEVCAESLLAINSLEELVEFYDNRGVIYDDKEKLLRRLGRDWSKCFITEIKKSSSVMPENIPFHSLEVDGKKYIIYGIAHHASMGEKYLSLVDNIFKEAKGVVLFEQHFGSLFPSAKKHLEMPDHFLYSFKDYFLENLKAMNPMVLVQVRKILNEVEPIDLLPNHKWWGFLNQ